MAQVSLGEIIKPETPKNQAAEWRAAFASTNSKRLDMAVFDRKGFLVLAVEFQGSGRHTGQSAFMRDAVKREALRKAGVRLLEVEKDFKELQLLETLREQLKKHISQSSQVFLRSRVCSMSSAKQR